MTYISQTFAIENYRSFKNKVYLEVKPFTIITGPNGSGKSTYTDLVKLYEKHFLDGKIPRNIPLSDLTNNKRINQIENWDSDSGAIKIYIKKLVSAEKISKKLLETLKIKRNSLGRPEIFGELVLYYKPDENRLSHEQNPKNIAFDKKQYTLVNIDFYLDSFQENNLVQNFDSNRTMHDFHSDDLPGIIFDLNFLNKLSEIKIDKKVLANISKYWNAFGPTENNETFFPIIGKLESIKHGSDTFIYDFILNFEQFINNNSSVESYQHHNTKFNLRGGVEYAFTKKDWKEFYSKSKHSKSLNLSHTRGKDYAGIIEFNTERIFENSLINVNDYPQINFFETFCDKYKVDWINDILNDLDIGNQILFKQINEEFIELTISKDDKIIHLNEFSKGLQRLIKLIIFLPINWWEDNTSDISKIPIVSIIEEPELSLHPQLQSKIADILSKIKKEGGQDFRDDDGDYDTSFIIETHSEYLIRKLQYLCAQKKNKQ